MWVWSIIMGVVSNSGYAQTEGNPIKQLVVMNMYIVIKIKLLYMYIVIERVKRAHSLVMTFEIFHIC